jgi:hypothetical protein
MAYISLPLDSSSIATPAEEVLKPYLNALRNLTSPSSPSAPVFTTFYTEHPTSSPNALEGSEITSVLVTPDFDRSVSNISDSAAKAGEGLFWAAVKVLKGRGVRPKLVKGVKKDGEGDTEGEGEDAEEEIEEDEVWPQGMWPPLEAVGDDENM